jgi:glucosamine-6-phosphate deaminase
MTTTFRCDAATVRVHDSAGELATAAAKEAAAAIARALHERGAANVMLATGNSQLRFLAELVQSIDLAWTSVTAFHMDEYVGLGVDHPASFRRYMRDRVAGLLPFRAFHYLDGLADPEIEAERYATLLVAHPLDLCVLGIGENGHLAFNDPPVADFDDARLVKVVTLDDACRRQQVGEGHFPEVSAVPTHAITVTIPALMSARSVIAIVPERRKAEPVRAALEGPVSTTCPASILRTRDHVSIHLDRDSASRLSPDIGAR